MLFKRVWEWLVNSNIFLEKLFIIFYAINIKGLIVSAEGTLIDYTQAKFDNSGPGLSEAKIADLNKNIKDNLAAVLNYNVGIEYTLPKIGLRIRGGYFVQPSAYKDDPSGFDRKYVTGGIGFLTEETIGLDIAYAHGWWQDIGDNYSSYVSRTYQNVTYNKVIMTATYRF